MKLLTTFAFLLLLLGTVFSQEFDARLLDKYSEAELIDMRNNNSDQLELLTYALDNAITYANFSKEKGQTFESISVPATDDTFLSLGIVLKDQNQYFKIEGTDKLLIVKSIWVLTNEMKKI